MTLLQQWVCVLILFGLWFLFRFCYFSSLLCCDYLLCSASCTFCFIYVSVNLFSFWFYIFWYFSLSDSVFLCWSSSLSLPSQHSTTVILHSPDYAYLASMSLITLPHCWFLLLDSHRLHALFCFYLTCKSSYLFLNSGPLHHQTSWHMITKHHQPKGIIWLAGFYPIHKVVLQSLHIWL